MGRRAFTDFIQIKNLRNGRFEDGKMVNLYFDLVIGSFTIRGVSKHLKSNSIRLNKGPGVVMKGNYVKTIVGLVDEAITRLREENVKRIAELD